MKKNITLKNSLMVIGIAMYVCLFHIETAKAQITFGEVKEAPKEIPDWERYGKKDLCVPFDSTYFYVKPYPLIDAYKKYIGQQFYLLEPYDFGNLLFSTKIQEHKVDFGGINYNEREKREKGEYTKTDIYCPICTYSIYTERADCKNNINKIINKYYDVIDVVLGKDVNSNDYSSLTSSALKPNKSYNVRYIDDNGKEQYKYVNVVTPCFILKETQSGDTVYTFNPDKFIIVGAFVKLQQESIGKTYYEYQWKTPVESKDAFRNYSNLEFVPEIKNKWKCINVTFIKVKDKNSRGSENDKNVLSYVFQNVNSISKCNFDGRIV